jgi:HEAT repeat protein
VLDRLDAAEKLLAKPKPSTSELEAATWFLQHERVADARAAVIDAFSPLAPDKRAARSLRLALSDPSAHVRAAAAQALGEFLQDPLSIAALKVRAQSDQSYATIAASVRSLADLKAPGIEAVLARALDEESNNGVIRSSALDGYAKVERKGAIPLEERYARYGAPLDSRNAAIRALGRIGRGDGRVTSFLTGLLGDPNLRTNFAVLGALAKLGDEGAIPAVKRLAATTEDERLRQASLETVAAIEAQHHASKKKGLAPGA